MTSSRIVATALTIFAVPLLVATTQSVSTAKETDRVRKEYRSETTPDHLMFACLLRITAARYEADRDFALEIVRQNMRLASDEEAEKFIGRMLVAGNDLARTKRIVETAILCQDDSARPKSESYRSMDSLDDARITVSKYAYSDFRETLSDAEEEYFKAWLDDAKEGYSFTALDHSSLYENRGVDVRAHVAQLCVRYAQEEQAGTKR